MAPHKLLVLYATQTGNARGIAKDIVERAIERGHDARVLGMESFKTVEFDEEPNILIVASSTGNGDCPDNGDKFHRYCKRKTTPQFLVNTRFAVCALGDSNYDAFCAVGKEFDQNFARLGGTRFLKRCDVDEVEGIETFVEPWLEKLWVALASLEPLPSKGGVPQTPTTADATMPVPADAVPAAPPASVPAPAPQRRDASADDEPIGTAASNPLEAPVVSARWLTTASKKANGGAIGQETGGRRVLHVDIDVSGAPTGAMTFKPGDALGIVPVNTDVAVDAVLDALAANANGSASSAAEMGTFAVPKLPDGSPLPGHLQGSASVRAALTSRVDIGSVSVWPPIPLLRVLLTSSGPGADAPLSARVKSAIATPPSAAAREAHASLQREKPSLTELLIRLGSAPPLAALLDALPPLAPRYYSIANSPTAAAAQAGGPLKVELCLSIVDYYSVAPDGTRTLREGLCSSMIARACAPLLGASSQAARGVTLQVFKREESGHELRLPDDPSTPVVLIGPGTGLAPFRGFIQHRRYTFPRNKLGPCHLFFGCRDEHEDFLYGDELTALKGSGAIQLHTAFSRSQDPTEAGYWRGARINIPYVQDRIEENAAALCSLLYERNGRVYVCGDGQAMAKDVHDALRHAIMHVKGQDAATAEAALAKLSDDGRYQREIWN